MADAKWEANVAIVRASSASDAPATGYKYPLAKKVSEKAAPLWYKRKPSISPWADVHKTAGFNYDWGVSDIEPNANIFGYLMALWLGSHTYLSTVITIVPGTRKQYFNLLTDRGLDLETSKPTRRLLGCQIDDWDLKVPFNEMAKFSMSGQACSVGANLAALAPTIPTGADQAPISWAALDAGYFKTGYNGVSPAEDNGITNLALSGSWKSTGRGRNLGSQAYTELLPGREAIITVSFDKEFADAGALADYVAAVALHGIEMDIKFLMGANYVTMDSLYGTVVDNILPEFGDEDGPLTYTIKAELRNEAGAGVITIATKDGSTAVYWS